MIWSEPPSPIASVLSVLRRTPGAACMALVALPIQPRKVASGFHMIDPPSVGSRSPGESPDQVRENDDSRVGVRLIGTCSNLLCVLRAVCREAHHEPIRPPMFAHHNRARGLRAWLRPSRGDARRDCVTN